MHWPRNIAFMVMGGVIVVTATLSTFSKHNRAPQPGQGQQHDQRRKAEEFVNRLPVADYNEPEPSDHEELQRRREKGAKYDKPEITVDADSEVVVGSTHWASGLPAFPLSQSNTVVVGTVTEARARMSNNKKGVYSEFTLEIEDVLKNDGDKSLKSDAAVSLDREGGRVRLPSGKVGIYYIPGQGIPLVGRRYLFFLSGKKSAGFTIVTGYGLHEGKVTPLDIPGIGHPFTKYDGADEQPFLDEVRAVIARPLVSH
jgi:hypothetical protein